MAWVIANADGHGFYRVRTSAPLREALVGERPGRPVRCRALRPGGRHLGVRARRHHHADEYLALADGFSAEGDVSVWRRLLNGVEQIERLLEGEARAALHARVRTLVGPALERIGWEDRPGDGDRDRELRGVLIEAMAALGDDGEAIARVADLFQRYCADPSSVEANVAAGVVKVTAALAGPDELDVILDRFRHGDDTTRGDAVPLRPRRRP